MRSHAPKHSMTDECLLYVTIVLQAGKAVFTRGDYERGLIHSLGMIKDKSKSLMEEAAKSHIYEFHLCAYSLLTSSQKRRS